MRHSKEIMHLAGELLNKGVLPAEVHFQTGVSVKKLTEIINTRKKAADVLALDKKPKKEPLKNKEKLKKPLLKTKLVVGVPNSVPILATQLDIKKINDQIAIIISQVDAVAMATERRWSSISEIIVKIQESPILRWLLKL